jgi:hypothetical protein
VPCGAQEPLFILGDGDGSSAQQIANSTPGVAPPS